MGDCSCLCDVLSVPISVPEVRSYNLRHVSVLTDLEDCGKVRVRSSPSATSATSAAAFQ